MRIIIFILLIFLTASCNMQRWCAKRFPPQVITETKVEIETEYRDTTIYIPVPGKIIHDSIPVPIPCPDLPEFDLSEFVMSKETNFAKAEAWLTFSLDAGLQMHLELQQKEQEIERIIRNAIMEKSTYTVEKRVEIKEVIVDNFWIRLYRWYFWVTLALFGGLVFARIKRII